MIVVFTACPTMCTMRPSTPHVLMSGAQGSSKCSQSPALPASAPSSSGASPALAHPNVAKSAKPSIATQSTKPSIATQSGLASSMVWPARSDFGAPEACSAASSIALTAKHTAITFHMPPAICTTRSPMPSTAFSSPLPSPTGSSDEARFQKRNHACMEAVYIRVASTCHTAQRSQPLSGSAFQGCV